MQASTSWDIDAIELVGRERLPALRDELVAARWNILDATRIAPAAFEQLGQTTDMFAAVREPWMSVHAGLTRVLEITADRVERAGDGLLDVARSYAETETMNEQLFDDLFEMIEDE